MAAPISAYRNGKLNMGTPSDPKSHLIAILQTSKSVMLSRFYLDEIVSVTLPDGTDGVVGAVIIGGANEAMHNVTTRGGVGRIMVSGQPARMLNDAGLNTLGDIDHSVGFNFTYTNWMNVDELEFKSAFYVDTSEYGIEFKKPSSSTWLRQPLGFFLAQNSVDASHEFMDITAFALDQDEEYQTRFYIVNGEGTHYSDIQIINTQGYLEQLGFYLRTAPCNPSGQVFVTLFMDGVTQSRLGELTTTPQSLDLYAYKNKYTFEEADTGWYTFTETQVLYYSQGTGFTHYQECTPAPTIKLYVTINIYNDSNLYTVSASTTETGSGNVVWNGSAELLNSFNVPIATLNGISVTIPSGQTIGNSSGTHSISQFDFDNTQSQIGYTTSVSGRGITAAGVQITVNIASSS